MEKLFALSSAIPALMSNGRLAIYKTLDAQVHYVIIKDETFEWKRRAKEEVFRCGQCKTFIFPGEKSRVKDGVKYHKDCKPSKKERPAVEELQAAPITEIPAEAAANFA